LLLATPGALNAGILDVPAEYSEIADALANAVPGDTVLVQEGGYIEGLLEIYPGVTLLAAGRREDSWIIMTDQLLMPAGDDSMEAILEGFTLWLPHPESVGTAIELDNPQSVVRDNHLLDYEYSLGGISLAVNAGAHIEGNLVASGRWYGIRLTSDVQECRLLYNTFAGCPQVSSSRPLDVWCDACYVEVRNNTWAYYPGELLIQRGDPGPVVNFVNNAFCIADIACSYPGGGDLQVEFRHNFFGDVEVDYDCEAVYGPGNIWGSGYWWDEFCDAEFCDYRVKPDSPLADGSEDGGPIGAWPVGCGPLDVHDSDPSFPTVMLSPPAPNPTSGKVHMSISAIDQAQLEVAVYDAAGRLVRELGSYQPNDKWMQIVWDGHDAIGRPVAPSTYFIVAETKTGRSVRRVQVLR